jgi:hypothetical protein
MGFAGEISVLLCFGTINVQVNIMPTKDNSVLNLSGLTVDFPSNQTTTLPTPLPYTTILSLHAFTLDLLLGLKAIAAAASGNLC